MNDHRATASQKERYWSDHFVRWERSGLAQRQYCLQHGLAVSTFQLRRRRLAGRGAESCLDIVPEPGNVLCVEIVGAGVTSFAQVNAVFEEFGTTLDARRQAITA